MPDRYVIVVPVNAPDTLAYLTDSFRNVPDVEVVADRRQMRPPAETAPVERRMIRRTQEAFGCTLVRIERSPAPPSPVASLDPIRLRDLPVLREG